MKITVDIAETPAALAQGLMFVKELPKNHGMLFKFPNRTQPAFWGKNTYIPLDIAFIRQNCVIDINSITPLSTRMIHSKDVCSEAIEVPAGFFKDNNITVGHKIEINGNEVVFKDA